MGPKNTKNKSGNLGLLPWNFSWLEPGVLAGTSVPETAHELRAMVEAGVAHLVSLSPGWSFSGIFEVHPCRAL